MKGHETEFNILTKMNTSRSKQEPLLVFGVLIRISSDELSLMLFSCGWVKTYWRNTDFRKFIQNYNFTLFHHIFKWPNGQIGIKSSASGPIGNERADKTFSRYLSIKSYFLNMFPLHIHFDKIWPPFKIIVFQNKVCPTFSK